MHYTLFEQLKKVLEKDERLVAEGELLRNRIVELAYKNDALLLKHLLADSQVKGTFFTDVDGVMVFDSERFVRFINNKQFLPDSYTAFKNKIGLAEGDEFVSENKNVVLNWPYKDCVLEGGQTKEDAKRDEVFWNETLAPDQIHRLLDPKVFTDWKRIDAKGEHKLDALKVDENGDIKDNLIIKGNNLLALHSLRARFAGKVKLIYIDPPYYFASKKKEDTFAYNSNFKLSTWLTFMRARLETAKELLHDEGVICVQISDDGVGELQVLMKEIFNEPGRNNFVNKITIKTKSPSGFATVNPGVFDTAEYILIFAKDKRQWKFNPQYVASDFDENYRFLIQNKSDDCSKWKVIDLFDFVAKKDGHKNRKDAETKMHKAVFNQIVAEYALENAENVFRGTAIGDNAGKETLLAKEKSLKEHGKIIKVGRDKNYDIYIKNGEELSFYSRKIRTIDGEKTPSILVSNIWIDVPYEGIAKEGNVTLKGGKKPEKLLRRIIELGTIPGDIVLDYHAGSGTTCATAHKLGRQWIGVEQLDYADNNPEARMKNVVEGDSTGISKEVKWKGGGDFVYAELMPLNQVFKEKVEKAKDEKELAKVWSEIQEKGFLSYKLDLKKFDASAKDFTELSIADQKRFILESLDYNQLYVNYSEMEDKDYSVKPEIKKLNKEFYGAD